MVVHKIEDIEEYAKFVQSHPAEIKALYHDMLINVTSFFRGPRVFDAMKSLVFPAIQKTHLLGGIRVWTPGCASGEETYSVAMALLEFLGEKASQVPIQFFGTDVSETSVARPRDARLAHVRSEELNWDLRGFLAQEFEQGHRNRIGFLSGGASGSPDPDTSQQMGFLDGGEYQGLHRVEYAGSAEKAGNVDQHVVIQSLDLRRMALYEFRVFLDVLDFVHHHAPLNTPQNRSLPLVREIHSGGPSQDLENSVQSPPKRRDSFGCARQSLPRKVRM